jgi:predicted TIM-barrel fold metal-dependent hydrolase
MIITDCHIHIQPAEMFKTAALEVMKKSRGHYDDILEYCRSPKALLKYMDTIGLERAVLINYVAPDTMGFTHEVNAWVTNYCKENPGRLIPCGSVHPRHSLNVQKDMDEIVRLGVRLIKIHPPHQLIYANDYLNGLKELETIYRAAEANEIPVMVHTGTSIFPSARNKYGDPIHLDDVAMDFPRLKILMAHGGRPIWMSTAFFLLRRHRNMYLDISGIPPRMLLNYFPRLEEIATKTLFGTDWPSPGIPDIKKNMDQFQSLDMTAEMKQQILSNTALGIWPA